MAHPYEMTRPKHSNQPFHHVLEALNAALPLEYAIRAARELLPKQFDRLKDIDKQMCVAWAREGYSEELIRADGLIDGCWDMMQLGYIEDRVPNRCYMQDTLEHLLPARRRILEEFSPQIGAICLPFSDRYRICDMLNGNDIARLIKEIRRKKSAIGNAPSKGDIPFSTFVLSIREPIPRYRGSVQQVHLAADNGSSQTHIGVMLSPDMDLTDINGALKEFLYHYAMFRKASKPTGSFDPVVEDLLKRWGLPSAPPADAEVTQLNELHTALNGLHCWDRVIFHTGHKVRGPVTKAIEDVVALYPASDQVTAEAVSGHYQRVKKRIEKLIDDELARQEQLHRRPLA
ncbi:hypothetical protein [Paraburkholderia caribensis]|uniref:hypothetical protein n=1 Tax=Paraburkholderia caribensis TaxID=75105 RepID=UPI002856CB24|nr:hypothetical protein [Paraburkholderia caribensis]MDR6379656.1 hypothetical protein [Paraburkholderia caribensis]